MLGWLGSAVCLEKFGLLIVYWIINVVHTLFISHFQDNLG